MTYDLNTVMAEVSLEMPRTELDAAYIIGCSYRWPMPPHYVNWAYNKMEEFVEEYEAVAIYWAAACLRTLGEYTNEYDVTTLLIPTPNGMSLLPMAFEGEEDQIQNICEYLAKNCNLHDWDSAMRCLCGMNSMLPMEQMMTDTMGYVLDHSRSGRLYLSDTLEAARNSFCDWGANDED